MVMSKGVVDLFEAVEVQQEQRHGALIALHDAEGLL